MATKKHPNKQAQRLRAAREAQAAALAARRRVIRQRVLIIAIAAAAVIAVVMKLVSGGGSSSSTTTATTASGSAAGKPCVATKGPLPNGAPAVPVKVGRPPTSLVTKDLKVGTGAVVTASQTLTVNYIGVACSTGKIFDSSYKSGSPATFALSGVIPGWQKGIPGMKVGGRRLLGIPPAQAYGTQGSPPDIAPDETLWFVVDVVDAKG